MISSPVIDSRTGEQIVEQGKALAGAYTPDWIPQQGDRGLAMLSLFGRLMEIVISRLNRVPEKSFLAFLDTSGISLLPPKAARAPVRFVPVEGAPDDGVAPAGTRIATVPPSGREPVTFESEKSLVVHRSRLVHLFTHDPGDDRYDNRGDVVDKNEKNESKDFRPFVGTTRILHRLYLAQDTLFRINHQTKLTLIFTLNSMSPLFTNLLQQGLSWKIQSSGEQDITPPVAQVTPDPNARTITVVLDSPLLTAIDATKADGVESFWVVAETKNALSRDEANLNIESVHVISEAEGIKPALAFFNTVPLDTKREFSPFGERPKTFDTFFLSIPEAFTKTGSRVTLQPSYRKGTAGSGGVELTYEFWNGIAWETLGMMNNSGSVSGTVNDTYDFVDTTNAFTAASSVNVNIRFDCPSIKPEEVNGKKNYWIRVRITDGNYGTDAKMTLVNTTPPSTLDKWLYTAPSFTPPTITSLTASYAYTAGQDVTACKTKNNFAITTVNPAEAFQPFAAPAEDQPALYFGCDRAFASRPVSLFIAVEESAFTTPPTVVWEYCAGGEWNNLGVQDGTANLTESGTVEFIGPSDATAEILFGTPVPRYWIRARLEDGDRQTITLLGAYLNTTWTKNCTTIRNEPLGSSTETPNAEYQLSGFPVLEGLKVEVREPDRPSEEELAVLRGEEGEDVLQPADQGQSSSREYWVRWHRVDHFRSSEKASRHFTVDWSTGRIRFGNGVNGMIPPAGRENIRVAWYQSGGGAKGNAAKNAITVLKRSIPFVEKAFNVDQAGGGSDAETAASVMVRGPQTIKNRGRAVTLEDYEWLAREASFQVARARCLSAKTKDDAGTVRLIIVPQSDEPQPRPSQGLIRQVQDHLNTKERRIGTANLSVIGPNYVAVSVQATVFPEKLEETDLVRRRVRENLTAFFHPLTGGPDRTGWEFGRDVYVSEVCKVIEDTEGVHHAEGVSLSSADRGLSGVDYIPVPDDSLVASGEHAATMTIAAMTTSSGGATPTAAAATAAMYLGNLHTRELHDLSRARPQCQIGRIRPEYKVFFSIAEEAQRQGYDLCGWCFGPGLSLR